jgi:glycosyltransferase involved in cell wall biosynthesis
LSAVLGGGITVAQNLTCQIGRQRPHYRIDLFCSHRDVADSDYPENVEVIYLPKLVSRLRRWRWEQFEMPGITEARNYAVVLALGGYLSFRTRSPQIAVWQNSNVFSPPGIARPLSERILVAAQQRIQSASMNRAAQNVFLTQSSVELASRWWKLDAIPHCVIHSGIDLETVVANDPVPLKAREPLALSVGHTYSHKNYENMIDAMDSYRRRFDTSLRLQIVGAPANLSYFEALQRRIADRGLGDTVIMSGPASSKEVFSLMSRARVYLVTSLLETFGLTMFEAMGQGLPVVASDATCHPEVCGDAVLYCDPRDPDQIADQLHHLVSDPDLAAEFRRRGFERVKHFSWERSAARYLEEIEVAAGLGARSNTDRPTAPRAG